VTDKRNPFAVITALEITNHPRTIHLALNHFRTEPFLVDYNCRATNYDHLGTECEELDWDSTVVKQREWSRADVQGAKVH
jgi:hypothetical protein